MSECFLCQPDPTLVYGASDNFFAMLGLGPIVPGYSLVATREHIPSMFDLDDAQATELVEFNSLIADRLETSFGRHVLSTEHGRVGMCVDERGAHEPHCYHAHRLVFPAGVDIAHCLVDSEIEALPFESFAAARLGASHLTSYLYLEQSTGEVLVGTYSERAPRQFFRRAVATELGVPELADWRERPGVDAIEFARSRLGIA
jgi:diadenosine tetraphosphate (Ap4A) HIT family hydrolase